MTPHAYRIFVSLCLRELEVFLSVLSLKKPIPALAWYRLMTWEARQRVVDRVAKEMN